MKVANMILTLNKDIEKLMLKEIANYKVLTKAENVTRIICHDHNIIDELHFKAFKIKKIVAYKK